MLKHRIKVSAYDRGFIHSKVIIVDNDIAAVGTANLDRLSFSKNYEVLSIIYDNELIKRLQNDFINNLKDSKPLPNEGVYSTDNE